MADCNNRLLNKRPLCLDVQVVKLHAESKGETGPGGGVCFAKDPQAAFTHGGFNLSLAEHD